MKRRLPTVTLSAFFGLFPLTAQTAPPPPAPLPPLPSARQLKWHAREYYGFCHFTVNTFTNKEWGYGDEDPAVFNPTALDTDQWARTARDAGMAGLIITAKHHDGFCLWPSRYTEHSVKNSPWKNGKGDVVGSLAESCRKYGLFLGVYLSPWDRNHAEYGRPAYIIYYRNQLRELLTNYGEIGEVWFDGANGGTGYYGGAREERRIDRRTYYDWENTWKIVRRLQPMAVIFSDGGPDIRWVGNERGYASETCWAMVRPEGVYPGIVPDRKQLPYGDPNGTVWRPAEVDVSIRPGWFYHRSQDRSVKSVKKLLDIYFSSVGHGCNLLLNVPPDRRGLFHETDVKRLLELRKALDRIFADDLARGRRARASNVRGGADSFGPARALDGDRATYWATDDGVTDCYLEVDLARSRTFNTIMIQEYIELGQRVSRFTIEIEKKGDWTVLARGTTIGWKRLLRIPSVSAREVRLHIEEARGCPCIGTFALFTAPAELHFAPEGKRKGK